ncbi:MAG: S4 domain-containing protein [Chitinophagaceae bacterium]|nr:S4 domain-containing protein [Chitinophagaceae bacterium]
MHGEAELQKAMETTARLFANQSAPAESLSIEDLEGLDGVVKALFPATRINEGVDVVSFLAENGIFSSKGEARKTIQGGGVSINRKKVEDVQFNINESLLLHGKYILVQKGKKNYYLVESA